MLMALQKPFVSFVRGEWRTMIRVCDRSMVRDYFYWSPTLEEAVSEGITRCS